MDNNFIPYASRAYVDGTRKSVTLKDWGADEEYVVFIENGKLNAYLKYKNIIYSGDAITVMEGYPIDTSSIKLIAKYSDDTVVELDDVAENLIPTIPFVRMYDNNVKAIYNFYGSEYEVYIPVDVIPFRPEEELIDFTYTDNGDGTYTITDWKGTYQGEPSTKIILPNNNLIIL